MDAEQLKIEFRLIRNLKTVSTVKLNKETEAFEVITGVSFDCPDLAPKELTMLLELMATGAPMNATFTCDQSMMQFEADDAGKLTAVAG